MSSIPGIDLSGLSGFRLSEAGTIDVETTAAADGRPFNMDIDLIDRDPDNARTEISEEGIAEMAESVKATGVREPISIRRNPAMPGRFLINSGERRWRGAKLAGKHTVPAFIDDQADEFDRFNVNEQRENLSPRDKARFYAKQAAKGLSLAEIGRKCSPARSKAYINQHLQLLKLPAALANLYERDVCRSPTTLYELARMHAKDSGAVEAAVTGIEEVTGALLRDLSGVIKAKEGGSTENGDAGGEEEATGKEAPLKTPKGKGPVYAMTIVVKHQGKCYQLVGKFQTDQQPATPGHVRISTGREEPIEVDIATLELNAITVMEK